MKKLLSIFILCIMFQCNAYSQSKERKRVDSLLSLLTSTTTDSIKLNGYVRLLGIYDLHDPVKGLTLASAAMALAESNPNKIYKARVIDRIGRLYWRIGNLDSAYKYHFAAIELYKKAGDKNAANYLLVEIGQDYLLEARFDESEKYLLKALNFYKETNNKKNEYYAYNILTALYSDQGNYIEESKAAYAGLKLCEELGNKRDITYATSAVASSLQRLGNYAEALKYYNKCLQLSIELNEKLQQCYFYISIGNLQVNLNNFPAAKDNYSKGLKVIDEMDNAWIVAHELYRAIGNMYRTEGNYTEALHYFFKTADVLRPVGNNVLASVYSEIGMVYTQLNQYKSAKKYLDSSARLCKKLSAKVTFKDYYSAKQLLDSAEGKWKDAYDHYKQYVAIKDSTFNKETLRKMVMGQMQYETDKKEAIAKSEQEKKDIFTQAELNRQRSIRNSALGVLAILLFFSIVVFFQRNKIAKEKKRSDQLVVDKELLLREIHHRVKNNLEVVSSLLALQSAQIDDPNTKEAMLEGQNRVHSIGIVHQKLYQGENPGSVEMKDYFLNLSESILDSFGAKERVTIELAMEKIDVDIDTAVPLGLIVNELLTNTLKYAFPNNQNGKVSIKLERQNGILHLEVLDNGIGKSGTIHGTGFGGQLISLLTRQLNGSMKEEIKNGTSTFFDFKLDKVA